MLIKSIFYMKKRITFIGAILSLISIGQPLIIKNLIVVASSALVISYPEKILAESFSYDFENAVQIFKRGNYNEAIFQFQKMLQEYPNISAESKSFVYLFLSMSHGYLNKHYAALEFINKAIDLNPTYATLYLDRATTKNYLGDKKGYCLDLQISMDLGNKGAKEFFDKWGCN